MLDALRARTESSAEISIATSAASGSEASMSRLLSPSDWLHSEYESDGELVLFRCRECGLTSMSLGSLHAHVERHRGYTRFGIQVPFTRTAIANFPELMKLTEVLRVEETTEVELNEVEGL